MSTERIMLTDIFPEPVEKPGIPESLRLGDHLWHTEDASAYVLSGADGMDFSCLINIKSGYRRRKDVHIGHSPFGREAIVKLIGSAHLLAHYEYLGYGVDGLRAALAKLEATE